MSVVAHIIIQPKDTYKAAAELIIKTLLILTLATIIPGIRFYALFVVRIVRHPRSLFIIIRLINAAIHSLAGKVLFHHAHA